MLRRVSSTSGIITAVAGAPKLTASSGDGGPASAARLRDPSSATFDAAGTALYIADTSNSAIRRIVLSTGIIGTVAGVNGPNTAGYGGDGAAATSARLRMPADVLLDAAGNMWIADAGNNVIRRVSSTGIITTVAGSSAGTAGFSGDGGAATAAKLNAPSALCSDGAGGYLIADSGNSVIRRVTAAGVISTVAGTGAAGFSGDGGLATSAKLNGTSGVMLDGTGFILADSNNAVLRRVSAMTAGVITTIAGMPGSAAYAGDGGAPTSARLSNPQVIRSDGAGGVLVADSGNNAIRRVLPKSMCNMTGSVSGGTACAITNSSSVACSISNVAPFVGHSVSLGTNSCTVTAGATLASSSVVAACPMPSPWLNSTLRWTSPFGSAAAEVVVGGLSSVVISSIVNGNLTWGSVVRITFNASIASTFTAIAGLALRPSDRDDVSIPCVLSANVSASGGLNCTLIAWYEGWSGGSSVSSLGVRIQAITSSGSSLLLPVTSVPPTATAVRRAALISAAPSLLSPSGGDTILVALPRSIFTSPPAGLALPSGAVCAGVSSTLRCFVGSAPCTSCVWLNTSAVRCIAPASTSTLLARVTVELCGLFNATSDGLAPLAAAAASTAADVTRMYVTYDPLRVPLAALMPSQPSTTIGSTTGATSFSLTFSSAAALIFQTTATVINVSVNGSACGSVTWSGASLLCSSWQLPLAPDAYSPSSTGLFSSLLQIFMRASSGVGSVTTPVTLSLPARVRSVTPPTAAAGAIIVVAGDYLAGDDANSVSIYAATPSLPCTNATQIATTVFACTLPAVINSSTPGFPALQMYVVNNRGVSSVTAPVTLLQVPTASVTAPDASIQRYALPAPASGSASTGSYALTPTLAYAVTGQQQAFCVTTLLSSACRR